MIRDAYEAVLVGDDHLGEHAVDRPASARRCHGVSASFAVDPPREERARYPVAGAEPRDPGPDGHDLARAIRERDAAVRVCALGAVLSAQDEEIPLIQRDGAHANEQLPLT